MITPRAGGGLSCGHSSFDYNPGHGGGTSLLDEYEIPNIQPFLAELELIMDELRNAGNKVFC